MADDILKNIPLPADLPENWTSDQIVAPTGAEAGLDEQHGYNYLMRQVNNAQKAAKAIAAALLNYVYPVGSLYMSAEATSPASLFGGTWEQIKDRFILAAGDTYAAGSKGGKENHTHLIPIGFDEYGHFYLNKDSSGNDMAYGSIVSVPTSKTNKSFDPSLMSADAVRIGRTSTSSNMPPYKAFYCWQRIA